MNNTFDYAGNNQGTFVNPISKTLYVFFVNFTINEFYNPF